MVGYWMVTADSVALLESRLRSALERAQRSPETVDVSVKGDPEQTANAAYDIEDILKRLDRYRRQYLGIEFSGNRRRILVNFFPEAERDRDDSHSYWKTSWVSVDDGGTDYFRIQFDVSSGDFAEFDCNGGA